MKNSTELLRKALTTKTGQQRYAATISKAQAEGIKAYESAIENGEKISEARIIGEAAKDEALLILMGIIQTPKEAVDL